MQKVKLNHAQIEHLVDDLRNRIIGSKKPHSKCYPIPSGGVPVAYALKRFNLEIVDTPDKADFFVDDIIDSGATRQRYAEACPDIPFYALIEKRRKPATYDANRDEWRDVITEQPSDYAGKWIEFAWSTPDTDIPLQLLRLIGEDTARDGLRETPERFISAWNTWSSGYGVNPAEVLKTFEDGAKNYKNYLIEENIQFYSHCEHHLAPFFGDITIAYRPNGRIVGLSKIYRLVEIYARRLQVQERMTTQIAEALQTVLQPHGVAIRVRARHLCMESRGICRTAQITTTYHYTGELEDIAHPFRRQF